MKEEPSVSRDELYSTDMGVGEVLRRTRMHYGQSIQDIERALRIKASQIEAIETGDIENLPGRVYAIGFVRSYSEYLSLDGDKMVKLFKKQSGTKAVDPTLDFPVAASDSKIPPLWLVGLSLLATVLIMALWLGTQSRDRANVTEIPPVPEELKTGFSSPDINEDEFLGMDQSISGEITQGPQSVPGASSAGVTDVSAIAKAQAPEAVETPAVPAPRGILLNILTNSWVEIKDETGKPLVSRVLKAGDQYIVPDRAELFMSLGNAGGVQIQIDGQALRPLGEAGQVRRNISLDADSLKSQYSITSDPKTIENIIE